MTTLEFYLPALDTEVTLIGGTLDASGAIAAVDLGQQATANISIPLATAKALFRFQSDSLDFTDLAADDIKYYVYYDGTAGTPAAFYNMNPANAIVTAVTDAAPYALGASDAVNAVKHDFVRYLAFKLFNTIHGVDLFSNEDALLANVVTTGEEVTTKIRALLAAVSYKDGTITAGSGEDKHMLNTGENHMVAGNIGRTIFRHIMASKPGRLVVGSTGAITSTAAIQDFPFIVGDYFVFKLTVNSSSTQTGIIGAVPPAAVTPRIYKIKLILA
jgi:hypothetical protein